MASMTINIDNFSEEQINEFCTKKFAELSDDVIEKIFTEAIRQRIEQSDLVDDLFVKRRDQYGRTLQNVKPTDLTISILEQLNFQEYFEPLIKEISMYILSNYEAIVAEAIISTFSNVLLTSFREGELKDEFYSAIYNHYNNMS